MTTTQIWLSLTAVILLFLTFVFAITKSMTKNVDNVDEDDDGVFRDKRDMV